MKTVLERLRDKGIVKGWRNELYRVTPLQSDNSFLAEQLFVLERAGVSFDCIFAHARTHTHTHTHTRALHFLSSLSPLSLSPLSLSLKIYWHHIYLSKFSVFRHYTLHTTHTSIYPHTHTHTHTPHTRHCFRHLGLEFHRLQFTSMPLFDLRQLDKSRRCGSHEGVFRNRHFLGELEQPCLRILSPHKHTHILSSTHTLTHRHTHTHRDTHTLTHRHTDTHKHPHAHMHPRTTNTRAHTLFKMTDSDLEWDTIPKNLVCLRVFSSCFFFCFPFFSFQFQNHQSTTCSCVLENWTISLQAVSPHQWVPLRPY